MDAVTAADEARPVISAAVKDILTIDGDQFKDLNANGKLDEYASGKPITRGEFIVKLLQAYGLNHVETNVPNFVDVSTGASYHDAVRIAKSLMITVGVGNNRFKPDQPITQQEMNVMAERAEELSN